MKQIDPKALEKLKSLNSEDGKKILEGMPNWYLSKFYAKYGDQDQLKSLLKEFYTFATDEKEAEKLGNAPFIMEKYKKRFNQLVKQIKRRKKEVPKEYDLTL